MITATGIHLTLGGQPILKDVSASFAPAATTAILGANGAGKSTLLKCLTGDIAPDDGQVSYGGTDLTAFSAAELAQKRAVLSQAIQVPFPFLAKEIVRMGRQPFEELLRPAENDAIAKAALKKVSGEALADRLYPTLSGGEKQRIQLARVLAQIWDSKDGILFLDEPNAALDLKFQMELMAIIAELVRTKGLTVVVILHDVLMARNRCEHAIMMKDGQITRSGQSRQIITNASVSETYDFRFDLLDG